MNEIFRDARANLDVGKTISGLDPGDQYMCWDALYQGNFCSRLESLAEPLH